VYSPTPYPLSKNIGRRSLDRALLDESEVDATTASRDASSNRVSDACKMLLGYDGYVEMFFGGHVRLIGNLCQSKLLLPVHMHVKAETRGSYDLVLERGSYEG